MGIDDPRGEAEAEWMRDIYRRLHKGLVMPAKVNILLAHEPSVFVFDCAAGLGIDLMLAGHTHGGQLALETVHRGFTLSRLLYRTSADGTKTEARNFTSIAASARPAFPSGSGPAGDYSA